MTCNQPEGSLYTKSASDGQVAFFTRLQLPTCDRIKNDCQDQSWCSGEHHPTSRYHALFPNKLNKSRVPQSNALLPTYNTWMSHDGSPKPFLGHFVAEVMHVSEPRSYLTLFYMLKDVTFPQSSPPMLHQRG